MALNQPLPQVKGIDLANYYPCTTSYNSVVYIHKKFLNGRKDQYPVPSINEKAKEPEPKIREIKKKPAEKIKRNKTRVVGDVLRSTEQTSVNNEEVIGQTIRFAKNIVPIVLPPNHENSPIYYTIKTSRKSRKTKNKPRDSTLTNNLTNEKQKHKKIIETYRKDKYKSHTESFSRESVSRSSKSNTIEHLVINRSLNCSVSEISVKKNRKEHNMERTDDKQRLVSSESFEALATELLDSSGDAKIKIHLMNDTAKDLLCESIRNPVIEAIKKSVSEFIIQKNTDCATVQRYVQIHTQKLDNILDKLACIENKLDGVEQKPRVKKMRTAKVSALEEIGEDVIEVKEKSSSDEDTSKVYSISERQKARCASSVVKLNFIQREEEKDFSLGGREDTPGQKAGMSSIPPDRARIPARYCWTDSTN